MATAIQTRVNKPYRNSTLESIKDFLSSGPKEPLKAIRLTSDWFLAANPSSGIRAQLTNMTSAIKDCEGTLSLWDFWKSATNFTFSSLGLISGDKNQITNFRQYGLKGIWDSQKLLKFLNRTGTLSISSRILTPFSAVGGISFALFSAENAYEQVKEVVNFKSIPTKQILKNSEFRVFRAAQFIGMMAIGIIASLTALFGTVTPFIVMQLIGTATLISTIYSKVLENSLKKEKQLIERKEVIGRDPIINKSIKK